MFPRPAGSAWAPRGGPRTDPNCPAGTPERGPRPTPRAAHSKGGRGTQPLCSLWPRSAEPGAGAHPPLRRRRSHAPLAGPLGGAAGASGKKRKATRQGKEQRLGAGGVGARGRCARTGWGRRARAGQVTRLPGDRRSSSRGPTAPRCSSFLLPSGPLLSGAGLRPGDKEKGGRGGGGGERGPSFPAAGVGFQPRTLLAPPLGPAWCLLHRDLAATPCLSRAAWRGSLRPRLRGALSLPFSGPTSVPVWAGGSARLLPP